MKRNKQLPKEDIFIILLTALAMRVPDGKIEVSVAEMDAVVSNNVIVTIDHDLGEEPFVIQAVQSQVN